MTFLRLSLSIVIFFAYTAKADYIAITFDDLPSQADEEASEQYSINQKIIFTLNKHHAPAIGFVNESSLFIDDNVEKRISILKLWINAGHTLGNHTYSHNFLSKTNIKNFEQDVVKGEKISKKLMQKAGLKYKYFRHPYLDTGGSVEVRAEFEKFLTERNYIIAPVTVDVDDWVFDSKFLENPKNKDQIIKEYLDHARSRLNISTINSGKIFGRNIKHILLLHVNLINTYALDDLLNMIKESGYSFITLDEALTDKIYQEKEEYYGSAGSSWLFRYAYTKKIYDIEWE